MKLSVLGKYGPYPAAGGATSGYLISSGNSSVVFECGSGTFSRLIGKTPPENASAVIISHYHSDHISDLGVYIYYLESLSRKGLLKDKVRLILPDDGNLFKRYEEELKYFRVEGVRGGSETTVGDMSFYFFEAAHPVYCLGFAMKAGQKKFVYSADTDVCDNLLHNIQGADLALLDGAFLPAQYRAGGAHMSVDICRDMAEKFGVKTLVSHLLPANSEEDYNRELHGAKNCRIVSEGDDFEF